MSAETQNTPPSPCDALLDYAYGELEGAAKQEFERHLADCEKCQRELEAFGKVRGAARAALPFLDPPASATGALHAQLLRAAAQRKPPRATTGKLLQLPRRMMQHPGWLAAASLLAIGGALGLNWSKGHLFMPAPTSTMERSAAEAAKPVDTELAKTQETTATPADGTLQMDKNAVGQDGSKENKLYINLPKINLPKQKMPFNVQHADPKPAPQFKARPARSGYVTGGDAVNLDLRQSADSFGAVNAADGAAGAKKETAPASRLRAVEGGRDDVRNEMMDDKVTTRPAEPPPPPAEPAPTPAAAPTQYQYRSSTGAAANGPAPSAPAPQPAPEAERQLEESPVARPQAVQSTATRKHGKKSSASKREDSASTVAEDSRKAFLEAVKSNNCDEVIRRYGELTRNTKSTWVTRDQEDAYYRCIGQARREQQTIDNAEQVRSKAAKKAKQAPAAADAPQQAAPSAASPAKAF
jgi:hypothetical protein